MTNYPVKQSHRRLLGPQDLLGRAREAFGAGTVEGDAVILTFGALSRLTARAAGKDLAIETQMDPKVTPEVAADTIRRYNTFLEAATGFTSKERAKRLRKAATSPSDGA